jgi:transposase
MDKGYSNAAACKIVGINVRTGSEWKNGSVRIKRDGKLIRYYKGCDRGEDRDFPSHFLNQSGRIAIADARREGSGVRAIARAIGRSPSTVSREITRNSHPIRATYSPHAAQERARARKPRPKVGGIAANLLLARYIQ